MPKRPGVLTTKKEWDSHWSRNEVDEDFDLDLNERFPSRIIAAIRAVAQCPGDTEVAEIGGGNGRFLLKFAAAGYRTSAIDISEIGLSRTQALFAKHDQQLRCVRMDMFDIRPEFEGRFDLVYSMGLCEHFTGERRRQQFIQHALLTRTGGAVLVMVPNLLAPFRIFWRIGRFLLSHAPGLRTKYGVRWVDESQFTRWELRRLFSSAGIEIVSEMGSSLVEDANFLVWGGIKKFICRSMKRPVRVERGKFIDARTMLDDYLGGDLFILGLKR